MKIRSRRGKARFTGALVGTAVAVPFLFLATSVQAEGELNLYNWGDYINPEVLQRFSEEHDVDVDLDTYGSNEEMLAKLQAGATGYDIVFPSVHMHDVMHHEGLLWKSNINEHPLFKEHIDPDFIRAQTDPESEWCLPYAWGSVGIFYNKEIVPNLNSWEDFFAIPEETGRKIIMLPDMREVLSVGLIMNGHSVNTGDSDEIKQATEFILERKDDISAFQYDGSRSAVAAGDVAAAQWYVGAMMAVRENPEKLGYIIPEEGATMYQEDMCILDPAPNKENAKKFMEFFLQPEIAALNAEQQMNGTPNMGAKELLPAELRNNPAVNPPPEVMKKLHIFEELGRDLKKYDRAWTRIRTE